MEMTLKRVFKKINRAGTLLGVKESSVLGKPMWAKWKGRSLKEGTPSTKLSARGLTACHFNDCGEDDGGEAARLQVQSLAAEALGHLPSPRWALLVPSLSAT